MRTSIEIINDFDLNHDKIIFIISHVNNYIAKLKSEASKEVNINENTQYEIALVLSQNNNDKELSRHHFEEAIRINQDFVEADK